MQKLDLNIFYFKIIIKIKNVDDFWSWSTNTLANGLRANNWYNGRQPYEMAGYLNDYSSRMMGYAILRQIRINNGKFNLKFGLRLLKRKVNFCWFLAYRI